MGGNTKITTRDQRQNGMKMIAEIGDAVEGVE
jgi:hypothetical protein